MFAGYLDEMDVGGLVSGLVSSSVYLMTRPLFLCVSACVFCLRTALITAFATTDMVSSAIWFNISMLWRAVWGSMWGSFLLLTFPVRLFAAIPRERLLEQSIYELRYELESLEWNRTEIVENLQEAIKEYEIMENQLDELEEEHDHAISKIEKLEAELQELKKENLRLKELKGKDYWNKKEQVLKPEEELTEIGSMKSVKSPLYPFIQSTIPKDEDLTPRIAGIEREIAISRSVFSAVLALVVVGIVMYRGKDQELCSPLIGAVFIVVGISLKSVVQFFSSVKNKPALDAIALMSLNWFILGTLTYPTLPKIASLVLPRVVASFGSALAVFGDSVRSLEMLNYVS